MGERAVVGDLRVEREARGTRGVEANEHGRVVVGSSEYNQSSTYMWCRATGVVSVCVLG